MTPKVLIATTTWNCVDIIERFLEHHRRLGVQRIYVIDYHSDDGTREVLAAPRWKDFVDMSDLPSLAGQDTSNTMLGMLRERHPGDWALFCDPDEFLVTPNMAVADLLPADGEVESIAIRRFNMTAPRSMADHGDLETAALDHLRLRICQQHVRTQAEYRARVLDPPWIYTAILDKTLVRIDAALSIAIGDHAAHTRSGNAAARSTDCYFMHFPIRSYRNFEEKVHLYRLDYKANPGQSGWHQNRWIKLLDAGTLRDEYLLQFLDDAELEALLASGVVQPEDGLFRVAGEPRVD
jgi:hypothetical protein